MTRTSTPKLRARFRPVITPLEDRLMPGDAIGGFLLGLLGVFPQHDPWWDSVALRDDRSALAFTAPSFSASRRATSALDLAAIDSLYANEGRWLSGGRESDSRASVSEGQSFHGIGSGDAKSNGKSQDYFADLASGDAGGLPPWQDSYLAAIFAPFAVSPTASHSGGLSSPSDSGSLAPRVEASASPGAGGSAALAQMGPPLIVSGAGGAGLSGQSFGILAVSPASQETRAAASAHGRPGPLTGTTFTWVNQSHPPPTLQSISAQTSAEGASVSLQANGSDSDGDSLSYAAVGLPPGLGINSTGLISGTIDYEAAESFGGQYTPTVILADSWHASTSTSFSWTVTDTNLTPTITNPGNQTSVQGDTITPLTVVASDSDGEAVTFSASSLPPGLGIDSSTGVISGTASTSAASGSPYAATVTADDGHGATASQNFTWTILTTNRTPAVTSPGNQSNFLGDSVSVPVSASDTDGNAMTYTATGLPPGLSIDPGTGVISGTVSSSASTSSPYTVTVKASDGALTGSQTFTWSLSHVSVTSPGSQANANGDTVSLQVQTSDVDGDTLSYSASGLPPGLSISSSTGLISGTISNSADTGSPYNSSVTASDGTNSTSQSFTWTVSHVSLTSPAMQTNREGAAVSLAVAAHDSDGDTLAYSASGLPAGLSINSSTGVISGTLASATHGSSPYTTTVTAADSSHNSSQSFTWVVTPHVVVIPPAAQNNADSDTVSLNVTASDSDGDHLTHSATGLPSGLSINSSTGVISGTVNSTADSGSPYTVTVTASDGTYGDSQTFPWTVSHVLVVNPGSQTNTDGNAVSLAISARDNDHDTLRYSATGLPTGLSINTSTGRISGTISNTADASSPLYGHGHCYRWQPSEQPIVHLDR